MIERVLLVLVVLGVTALVIHLWRRREGRFGPTRDGDAFRRGDIGLGPGERPEAVVVEFGTEHCAPCRTVERHLRALSDLSGVRVVTIDAGHRLDLADRYQVRRVPTIFVADGDLRILHRASGVVTEDALREQLRPLVSAPVG